MWWSFLYKEFKFKWGGNYPFSGSRISLEWTDWNELNWKQFWPWATCNYLILYPFLKSLSMHKNLSKLSLDSTPWGIQEMLFLCCRKRPKGLNSTPPPWDQSAESHAQPSHQCDLKEDTAAFKPEQGREPCGPAQETTGQKPGRSQKQLADNLARWFLGVSQNLDYYSLCTKKKVFPSFIAAGWRDLGQWSHVVIQETRIRPN